ncbi:MAG: GNAT family N-acetyltransferase [Hungatella sp.]|nr:GNAT family N-acetyltransferase [Hungatella sp.]
MLIETKRLILREMEESDYEDLAKMLQDDDVMYAYEGAFSDEEVRAWLERQIGRYRDDGFGLWAVILKENGEMIGQCGLTMQDIPAGRVVETGYLFRKEYWHRGYAGEAAAACTDYGFDILGVKEIFSVIRDTNTASRNVAKRNGMEERGMFVKHYRGTDMPHCIYSVRREDRHGNESGERTAEE